MQKKADAVFYTQRAQLGGHGHQLIIVNPDEIARFQQGHQCLSEGAVDGEIGFVIRPVEAQQAGAVMQQGPERAIGEPVIEFLVFALGDIDGGEGHTLVGQRNGGLVRGLIRPPSAPAEPEGTLRRRIGKRHGQTARGGGLFGGRWHAVGNDDGSICNHGAGTLFGRAAREDAGGERAFFCRGRLCHHQCHTV
jgi:hypothetical protein